MVARGYGEPPAPHIPPAFCQVSNRWVLPGSSPTNGATVFMTQQLPDRVEVDPAHDKRRGEGMSQIVKVEIRDLELFYDPVKGTAEIIGEGLSVIRKIPVF